jgi:hypothetical protein
MNSDENVRTTGRMTKLHDEWQAKRVEWNEFCDYIRTECTAYLDMDPAEAGKLKLDVVVRLAMKMESARLEGLCDTSERGE